MGEIPVPAGNFSVTARGPDFGFGEYLPFRQGEITSLTLEVIPVVGRVLSLTVHNQDTLSGVEPTGTIYAEVAGSVAYAVQTPTKLVGYLEEPVASQISLAVTVVGYYGSPQGTLVILRPASPYSSIPSSGITLLQYRTNATVSFIGI